MKSLALLLKKINESIESNKLKGALPFLMGNSHYLTRLAHHTIGLWRLESIEVITTNTSMN